MRNNSAKTTFPTTIIIPPEFMTMIVRRINKVCFVGKEPMEKHESKMFHLTGIYVRLGISN